MAIINNALSGALAAQVALGVSSQNRGNQQHQLTVAEMPSHNHATGGDQVNTTSGTTYVLYTGSRSGYGTSSTGGNPPHTKLQPTPVVK